MKIVITTAAKFACGMFVFLGVLVSTGAAHAYPERPVRLLVGWTPGGGADVIARIVAEPLGKALGRPVAVENLPGASGAIALQRTINSTPDG